VSPFDFTPPANAPDPFQRAFNYPLREVPQAPPLQLEDHHTLRMRPELLLDAAPESMMETFRPAEVRILGQIQESYIIACNRDGLLIVDQHVAHERILYEKFALAMSRGGVEVQGLLVPVTVELAPHQIALLERLLPELNRNGFQVERFGGDTVVVRGVPAVAGEIDCRKLLAEILEGLEVEERTLDVDRIRDRMAVSMACRAAIKVHTPLTMEKMQWLLDELGKTRIPTNCPHGRPILLRFSLYEIERNFGRA
jgi:DNA mismatch repair protein MutL